MTHAHGTKEKAAGRGDADGRIDQHTPLTGVERRGGTLVRQRALVEGVVFFTGAMFQNLSPHRVSRCATVSVIGKTH